MPCLGRRFAESYRGMDLIFQSAGSILSRLYSSHFGLHLDGKFSASSMWHGAWRIHQIQKVKTFKGSISHTAP